MANGKYVSYLRVSTARQGVSGLGLEAQQDAVRNFLNGGAWELMGEFQEVETGAGSDALAKRPQLAAALDACRKHGATLLIAKLDRLARNLHFISGLMEGKVRFVACDMPEASELTVHIMAAFAQHEAKRISQRTKDAIAARKARVEAGTDKSGKTVWKEVWGVAGAANLKPNLDERRQDAINFGVKLTPIFESMKARNLSHRKMVEELNCLGIGAARGGKWNLSQVQRLMNRIHAIETRTNPNAGVW